MIKPQFLNLVNSSFLLFLDNYLLTKTEAYTTGVSSRFYPENQKKQGLYSYRSPYSNFNYDTSITNCPVISGLYINNTFCLPGTSGFSGIDYLNGRAWFSQNLNGQAISGTFTVKDIGVLPLNISEEKLLFETKFELRKPNSQSLTGLPPNSYTYPAIYVKGFSNKNKPFAFGGEDLSEITMGLFFICDSAYMADALKSVMADMQNEVVPLLTVDKMPFSALGTPKNTGDNINYHTLTSNYTTYNYSGLIVDEVTINSFKREFNLDFQKINPDTHIFIADITLSKPRFPRNNRNNI